MDQPNPGSSPQSRFATNVITLVKGTTASLLISILASPVITRLYGPEAFGLAALFMSMTSIISVVACLSYEPAIVLPKKDDEAANVFGLCMFIGVCVALAAIPVLLIFQQPLLQFLNAPELGPFILLIPLTVLINGTFLALNFWNTRTQRYHRLSVARVTSSLSTTGTQLGFGFFGYATGGVLIGATIFGQIASTLILGLQIMREYLSFFKQNISWKGMVNAFKEYSNFPKYQVMGSFINTLSWQIPVFLLSFFFSKTIVGYYSLGMMVIQTPITVIGAAIAQVFFQRAAMAKHEGTLSVIFTDTYTFLVKISLFPLLLLTFIGKDLFIFLFGPLWGEAGFFIQILSVFAVSLFITSPLSSILNILGKQKIGFMLSSISLILRLGSIYLGGILGSAALAILLFSISGMIGYGCSGIFFMHLAGVKIQNTLKILIRNILVFLPAGIIMVLAKILNLDSVIEIILAAFLLTLYFVYLLKTDQAVRDILGNFRLIKHI
jgi:O-antigen/teichoic acid export membrane protein